MANWNDWLRLREGLIVISTTSLTPTRIGFWWRPHSTDRNAPKQSTVDQIAEETIFNAEAKTAYFKALREEVPELMKIAMGHTGETRHMVTKSLLITLFATSVPVFADTLLSGSVYFDSQKTLEEVVKLSAEKDNESILKLIKNGHVSERTDSDKDIVVLTIGITPESPAEFRFPVGPTTYWTLTKFVTKSVEPTPTPTPERSLSLTVKRKHRKSEHKAHFRHRPGE